MKISHLFFVLATPLLVYPQDHLPHTAKPLQTVSCEQSDQFDQLETNYLMAYDGIINLLEDLESGELEKKCSLADLERVNQLIVWLARAGLLADDFDEELALEEDIEELLYEEGNSLEYIYSLGSGDEYMIVPAVLNGYSDIEIILCKSLVGKIWKKTKKFVKNHKKGIIIGTVAAVAALVIIATAGTGSGAAAAGVAAAASSTDKPEKSPPKPNESSLSIPPTSNKDIAIFDESPILKKTIDKEILFFKEEMRREQFFQPINPSEHKSFPWEKTGRVVGPLFAAQGLNHIEHQMATSPSLSLELQTLREQNFIPIMDGEGAYPSNFGQEEINHGFSPLAYQMRGEKALELGYYNQAIDDFGKAIELNSTNPSLYLDRGTAHFSSGEYDRALDDFDHYTSQSENTHTLSISEFSLGLAKELPKGIYESGKGMFLLLTGLTAHPIHTGKQIWDALSLLSTLARSNEWAVLGEVLVPEVYELVTQWDTLPSDTKGELAGHAFGKYGADILIPGVVAKTALKGMKGAQKLNVACKGLKTAEKTLVLETASEIGTGVKVAEFFETGKNTINPAEKLEFTTRKMSQIKKTGQLEGAINSRLDRLITQSESQVLKAAISRNKHIKMVRDYLDKSAKEIQKGINSYEKQINIHKDKIANPTKHYPDWDKLDPRQREALINKKWPVEIKGYEEQKEVLQSILNERLSYE